MPITIATIDNNVPEEIDKIFSYFSQIDKRFSTYKRNSEMSKINRGEIHQSAYSQEMKTVFALCEKTKEETSGYFDINFNGFIDPSGLVKGWAVYNASILLLKAGINNFYIDAGGDIQVSGKSAKGEKWKVGIKNPFKQEEIIKILEVADQGVATSGTYIRGQHIYNPINQESNPSVVKSLTIIGPNIYQADRFATAAFAMGRKGIHFIESLDGYEGYMIDYEGIGEYTGGFEKYVVKEGS